MAGAAAILLVVSGQGTAAAKQDILIGGADKTGVYYQVATQICALVNTHYPDTYNCVGRPSLGSTFNINAVDRGLLDFGVAQSDRNSEAWNGETLWDGKPVTALRSVFTFHPELLHLVARRDARIRGVRDLRGKSVNIGNAGSGQRGMAQDVLHLYGLDRNRDVRAEGLEQVAASKALINGTVEAFFYSVGLGAPAIERTLREADAVLVPVNSAAVKSFVAAKPYYTINVIPGGTYAGIADDVETYALNATIVARADTSAKMVHDLVKVVFENLEDLKKTHPAFSTLTPENMRQGLSAPLHKGAQEYFTGRGWK